MSNPRVETLATVWDKAFQQTGNVAGKVPEEKRVRQVQEGKPHPLWLMGHLANSNNMVVNMWACGGESVFPKDWRDKFAPDFGGGIPPKADASFYPAWDEVLEVYNQVAETTLASIRALTDADLDGDWKGKAPDQPKQYFGSITGALIMMASHDAHHRGQMAMISALA